MDAQHPYSRINEALNQVFFDGRFAGQLIYLSLDNEMRDELAHKLGCDPSEVEDQICACVRRFLGKDGDPYGKTSADTRIWQRSGMNSPPPFTGILFCLSHAAALMAADGAFGANNYYLRLSQLTGLARDILSSNRMATERFWEGLAAWLLQNNYALGRPSARATNAWRFVGMAMSQAIVRASDRLHFHDMFEKFHFSGSESINTKDMEHYLSAWMATAGPTPRLKKVWRDEELRERVAESAIAELAIWSRGSSTPSANGTPRPVRMLLLANLVSGFPRHSLELHLGRVGDAGPRGPFTLRGSGSSFYLANEIFGGVATLSPPIMGEAGKSLSSTVQLDAPSGSKEAGLEWESRLIIPLAMNAQANTWMEVQRVAYGVPNLVLVRDANNLPAFVERYFLEACLKMPAKATSSQLEGLPQGWVLYQDVQVRQVLEPDKREFECLVPIGDDGALMLEGGLQLLPGFFHARGAPTASFVAPAGPTRIEATSLNGSVISSVESDAAECCLSLSDIALTQRDAISLLASRGKDRAASKEVFFRDAGRPHPLNQDSRGQLAYRSILSAEQVGLSQGMHLEGFTVYGELPHLKSFSASMLVQIHEGSSEDVQAAVLASPIARHESTKACLERGYHITRYPPIPQNTPPGTPVEGVCTDCKRHEITIYKRRPTQARVGVPPPARVQMRSIEAKAEDKASTTDHDLLLDALCFLGHGTWARFISLAGAWDGTGQHPREIAHMLFLLGHLDLELRQGTNIVKSWSVPAPSLNFTQVRSAFLSGFRSASLIEDIAASVRSVGGRLVIEEIEGRPPLAVVEGLDEAAAVEALASIRDPLGRALAINADPAGNVARACIGLPGIEASLAPVSVGRSRNLQRFDLATMLWSDVPTVLGSGAYRWNEGLQLYAYVGEDGVANSAAYRVAKLLAARERGVRLHHHDAAGSSFISTLGCEPPGLLERALVACSGRLPTLGKGIAIYNGVPARIASSILSNLYTESHFEHEASQSHQRH